MAKTIRDEVLRWNLVINGDSARKELNELMHQNRELGKSIKDLEKESKRLERAKKTESDRYKEVTAELEKLNATYSQNKNRIESLQSEIGITSKTMSQLRREANMLRMQLSNTVPGSQAYDQLNKRLVAVSARMDELRKKGVSFKFSLDRLADGMNRYSSMAFGVAAAITGVVVSFQNYVNGMSEMAQAEANVMKTTGFTLQQVRELKEEFKTFNTATPVKELLALAEEAGRLGKNSKKDVLDFVRTANMLKVALGDDLGEDSAILDVGKLTEQFKIGEKNGVDFGRAMEMLGSAINKVSASGANQASYLVDFSKRVSGIDQQVGLGAQNILGYAAALDEAGQSAEVSGTLFNKILPAMFTDTATFAKVAKMETSEFAKLLKTDANAAFLALLEGLQGNNEGFEVMAKKMNDMQLDGARSISVLASLANNTDKIRERQKLANEALQEGTSLMEEYTIKNENFASSYEKIKKYLVGKVISSEALSSLERWGAALARITEIPLSQVLEEQRMKLQIIASRLQDANISTETRIKLIQELKTEYPEYLGHLDEENTSNLSLFKAIDDTNKAFLERIRLRSMEEETIEARRELTQAEMDLAKKDNAMRAEVERVRGNMFRKEGESYVEFAKRLYDAHYNQQIYLKNAGFLMRTIREYENSLEDVNELTAEFNSLIRFQEADKGATTFEQYTRHLNDAKKKLQDLLNMPSPTGKNQNGTPTAITPEEIKAAKEARDKHHAVLLSDLETFFKHEQAAQTKARTSGLISEESYQEGLRMMQFSHLQAKRNVLAAYLNNLGKDETDKRASINAALADIDKQAAEWELNHLKQSNDQVMAEFEKYWAQLEIETDQAYERLKAKNALARREAITRAEVDILKSTPGSQNELDAQKRLLDAQQALALENTFLTELEREKIILEFDEKRRKLDTDYWMQWGELALTSVGAITSSIAAIKNAELQNELDRERQANDEKKKALREQLDSKRISEEGYRTQLARLDDEYRVKEREIKTEQFKRQRNADAIQAGINTALSVTRLLHNPILAVAAGIAGAAQVATILGKPVPEFKDGLYPVTTTSGKKYNASYSGPVKTGFFSKPTLGLFGEAGEELVISGPHLSYMRMNYPEIIDAIMYTRTPQYAAGKYPVQYEKPSAPTIKEVEKESIPIGLMTEMYTLLLSLKNDGMKAHMSWRQYNDFKEQAEKTENEFRV